MRTLSRGVPLAIAAAIVVLSACAPTAPASPTAAQPASATAAPSPAGASSAEWDQVLAAAKSEGTVSVTGPDGDNMRRVLTEAFQNQYGIQVDYIGDPGPGIPPRVLAERGAGQFNWDVYVGGTTTSLTALLPGHALDPIDPDLILPDVKDPNSWRGGGLEFLDDQHEVLVMTPFQRGTIFVNPTMTNPEDFHSYRDLLDPKWKGKIVLDDPRKAGPGQATFTFFYLQPDLGPDFIRALGTQDMTIIKDFQQETDMVGQGRFPILLGGADFAAVARQAQGVPIEIVNTRQLAEGSDVSPANGSVSVYNHPAHPNAAKVYLNWLLSKDAQLDFAKSNGYISSRLDVPTDFAPAWRIPVPGAIRTYDAQAIAVKDQVLGVTVEALGSS